MCHRSPKVLASVSALSSYGGIAFPKNAHLYYILLVGVFGAVGASVQYKNLPGGGGAGWLRGAVREEG